MLDYNQTAKLLLQAKDDNQQAKETLLIENTPLLKSIIKRFYNKGIEYDDLFQLASMGFIKAIKNFDFSYNVKFSTYAVPMITGEIKRFLRDDGYIKVSRSLKVLYNKIYKYTENIRKKGREPTIEEIAKKLEVSTEDVVLATECVKMPISLFEKSDEDERSLCLVDKLVLNDDTEETINKIVLKNILSKLSVREKKIIMLRYFRDMTQSEVAKVMNVSQVQISRLESKILKNIKKKF